MRARIELQTAISLGRAGGKVYVRGKPVISSDRAEIEWAENNGRFSVTMLGPPVKSKAAAPADARTAKKEPAKAPSSKARADKARADKAAREAKSRADKVAREAKSKAEADRAKAAAAAEAEKATAKGGRG